jgi:rubredoxin
MKSLNPSRLPCSRQTNLRINRDCPVCKEVTEHFKQISPSSDETCDSWSCIKCGFVNPTLDHTGKS